MSNTCGAGAHVGAGPSAQLLIYAPIVRKAGRFEDSLPQNGRFPMARQCGASTQHHRHAWCKCQDIQSCHDPFVSLDPVLTLHAEQQHTLTCSTSGLRARNTGVRYPTANPTPVREPRNSHLASMHRHPCTAVVWHALDLEPHCQCNTGTLERLTTPAAGMEHSNRIAAVVHRCKDIGIRWPPRHFSTSISHRF